MTEGADEAEVVGEASVLFGAEFEGRVEVGPGGEFFAEGEDREVVF